MVRVLKFWNLCLYLWLDLWAPTRAQWPSISQRAVGKILYFTFVDDKTVAILDGSHDVASSISVQKASILYSIQYPCRDVIPTWSGHEILSCLQFFLYSMVLDFMILKNANLMLTVGHYYQHLLNPDIQYVVVVNLSAILSTTMIKMLLSRNLSMWLAVTIYHRRRNW